MALSKLAISLIAGIGSIAAVGGITAGVIVSRNNTVVETTNENDESNSRENKSSEKNESLMKDQPRSDSTNESTTMKMKDLDGEKITQEGSKMEEQPNEDTEMKSGGTSSVARQEAITESSPTTPAASRGDGKGAELEQPPIPPAGSNAKVMGDMTPSGSGGTDQSQSNLDSIQEGQDAHKEPEAQRILQGENDLQDH